ncbi:MAG: hypothetical protein AAF664_03155 [Planctomycetota bacterium]
MIRLFFICSAFVAIFAVVPNVQFCFAQSSMPEASLNDVATGRSTSGRETWIAVGDRGTILRSEDVGETWIEVPTATNHRLHAIAFLGGSRWIAAGGYQEAITGISMAVLVASNDNGLSWKSLDAGDLGRLTSLEYSPDQRVLKASGDWSNSLLSNRFESLDGGITWQVGLPDAPSTKPQTSASSNKRQMRAEATSSSGDHLGVGIAGQIWIRRTGRGPWTALRSPQPRPKMVVVAEDLASVPWSAIAQSIQEEGALVDIIVAEKVTETSRDMAALIGAIRIEGIEVSANEKIGDAVGWLFTAVLKRTFESVFDVSRILRSPNESLFVSPDLCLFATKEPSDYPPTNSGDASIRTRLADIPWPSRTRVVVSWYSKRITRSSTSLFHANTLIGDLSLTASELQREVWLHLDASDRRLRFGNELHLVGDLVQETTREQAVSPLTAGRLIPKSITRTENASRPTIRIRDHQMAKARHRIREQLSDPETLNRLDELDAILRTLRPGDRQRLLVQYQLTHLSKAPGERIQAWWNWLASSTMASQPLRLLARCQNLAMEFGTEEHVGDQLELKPIEIPESRPTIDDRVVSPFQVQALEPELNVTTASYTSPAVPIGVVDRSGLLAAEDQQRIRREVPHEELSIQRHWFPPFLLARALQSDSPASSQIERIAAATGPWKDLVSNPLKPLKTDGIPVLDGKAKEAFWQQARSHRPNLDELPNYRIATDDKYVYMLIEGTRKDQIRVRIDLDGDLTSHFSFGIGSDQTTFGRAGRNRSMNARWYVAQHDDQWELAIRRKDFAISGSRKLWISVDHHGADTNVQLPTSGEWSGWQFD